MEVVLNLTRAVRSTEKTTSEKKGEERTMRSFGGKGWVVFGNLIKRIF